MAAILERERKRGRERKLSADLVIPAGAEEEVDG